MIKLFEMFSGYGGASFSLKKAGIPFECVGHSEIDKFAISLYNQNHEGVKNFGDCKEINPNELPDFDLLTGGFPCQPFSASGKGLGEMDIRGTLFREIIRIAEIKKPKFILLENVKGLTFKNQEATFNKIISELKRIGYNVFWKVLNSKDYGTPQSRARVFFVCFRNTEENKFNFPKEQELNLFVKDILEREVEEKYFLSEKYTRSVLCKSDLIKRLSIINPQIAITQTARQYSNWKGNFIISAIRGRYEGQAIIQRLEGRKDKCSNTLTTVQKDNMLLAIDKNILSLRQLTPKECFRLMGFLENEINIKGFSDYQLYKLAGNGWDVNLISKILREIFRE